MAVERVVLFVIDGLRPDALALAHTPTIQRMIERGAHTLRAQTVMPSITLPTHMSMLHGIPPEVHGVFDNTWQPMPGGPLPGLFELVRQAGKMPAAFHTWEPLRDLARPGALAYSVLLDIYGPEGEDSDRAIAALAADYLIRARPDFCFVYLGLTDEIGHHHGWLSPKYLQAVSVADEAVARVWTALEESGLAETTACLLLADHGGQERAHGSDLPEDMTIPWILTGPGVKQGFRLEGLVQIMDTAPTIAHLLGLPIPSAWQGRVVSEALE